MKKTFKIIIFLLLMGAAGFYFGLKERPIEVSVREAGTTTTQTLVLKGGEVMTGGFLGVNPSGKPVSWPWYTSRAAAIGAYLLMFVIIVWGMGMTTGFTYKITNPVKAWGIHKYMSISLGVLILVHIISLLFDEFINFGWADILIPFRAEFKPLYLGLGIIGFYILVAVIFSSLLLRVKAPRFWRAVHYLVYPLFVVSFLHGVYTGTDSVTLAMRAVYWVTGALFALLLFYRFVLRTALPE